MTSTLFDVALVGGLLLSGFLGYKGGFTKKALDLIILLASIVVGINLMIPFGEMLKEVPFPDPWC